MEFVLIHKPLGPLPPEVLKKTLEFTKMVVTQPSRVVPDGRLVASYNALGQWVQICVWEAPSADALTPLLEGLRALGFNTEVIPVEKVEEAIPKWEKGLSQKL